LAKNFKPKGGKAPKPGPLFLQSAGGETASLLVSGPRKRGFFFRRPPNKTATVKGKKKPPNGFFPERPFPRP